MLAGIIAPVPHLNERALQGGVHLVLAHWMLQNDEYAAHYQAQAKLPGTWVILDNGAHEHKASDPLESLCQVADFLHPHEIVLPDVINDPVATVQHSTEAFYILKEKYPNTQLMVVPQGHNFAEWVQCLDALLEFGTAGIAIPRIQADQEYSWMPHMRSLVARKPKLLGLRKETDFAGTPDMPSIHLLGSPHNLTCAPEVEVCYPGVVRSTDTSKPFHYAMQGIRFSNPLNSHQRNPASRPPDFLTRKMSHEELSIALYNAQLFRDCVRTTIGYRR